MPCGEISTLIIEIHQLILIYILFIIFPRAIFIMPDSGNVLKFYNLAIGGKLFSNLFYNIIIKKLLQQKNAS